MSSAPALLVKQNPVASVPDAKLAPPGSNLATPPRASEMSTVLEGNTPSSRRWAGRPVVVDVEADRRFRELARGLSLDPDARFVGGYVEWEWAHARHVFDGLVEPAAGRSVLELGCNLGATAIVL